ncbi:MAG TPA: glutamate synthase-related protein, partial [Pedococcus sp.]|nr:glutamate synthase-related protein [Pedococcus sp.]
CPVGVATQDARRARAVDVEDKSQRVMHYQQGTVEEAVKMMASMGAHDPRELSPSQLRKVISAWETRSYAELFEWLAPGQLLAEPPQTWAADWAAADPSAFRPSMSRPRS